MYKDIIKYIMETALKHKAIKAVKYQSRLLINAQPTNPSLQFVIEDNADVQFYKTSRTMALNLNIDVIGHPDNQNSSLDIQSYAFQAATEIMGYVDGDPLYQSILSTLDKDFLFLSHFTDDDSSGVRLSWQIAIPEPLDNCTLADNFDESRPDDAVTDDIDLKPLDDNLRPADDNPITLKPVRLPKNKK